MLYDFIGVSSGRLEIIRNTEFSLLLKRSKVGAFFGALLSLAAIVTLLILYFTSDDSNKIMILFMLLAVTFFSFHSLYLSVYAIINGEYYKFKKKKKIIYRNHKKWFNFKEITAVKITHSYDSENNSYDYSLYLVSIGGHEYQLDSSGDINSLSFVAEEIAYILDVRLVNQHI